MRNHRPRIGITMRIEPETDRFYLSRHYSEAVEAAGGLPVHLSLIPNSEYIATIAEHLDGVLLPGSNSDVDPLRYGHEPHQALGSVHSIKDETDLLLLNQVEARALPLFAICFGMQIFNVFRGGTLIQDIPSQVSGAIKHEQGAPRDRPSHRVTLEQNSLLSALAGETSAVVNSHHHQAIDTIGNDLIATAWTSDGLVEALEETRSDRFSLAVQWHPELGWRNDSFSQSLFERFVKEAIEYSGRNQDLHYAAQEEGN
jgi:putative glutamine amidotransferase